MARADQKQFDHYLSLVKSGMKPSQAVKIAYPNGVPTKEKAIIEADKKAEKKQIPAALAQAGGTVGGALAVKGASDAISGTGWFAPTAEKVATETAKDVATETATDAAANTSVQGASEVGAQEAAKEGLAPTGTESTFATYGIPLAALLATAYIGNEAYKNYKGSEGKSAGEATKDSAGGVQGALNYLIGGPYGWMVGAGGGLAGSLFGSKKDEDQKRRDAIRKGMLESGFVDKDYNVNLAEGKKFNIGADGSEQLYNIDLKQADAPRDLNLVAPLAKILTGGDEKLGSDFAGYFTNAVRSGGDPLANAKELYAKAGITSWDQGRQALRELTNQGKLTEEELAVYDQGLANIFGDVPLAQSQQPLASNQLQGRNTLASALVPPTSTPISRLGA